ncbi:MAG TPA: acyl-ACP--UDP-N-acetylglucosamine O-acyltransferase [Pirellulaceae bacterium]|nr:acyl-ACP--UDP-N-acetylglucosamine O-acyltransferase [Pirellulaceae bacterium]
MATNIHPTAVVSPKAELGRDVTIGPFCVVEDFAVLGDGCSIASRAVIKTNTVLGCNNEVGEGSVIGGKPQHAKVGNIYGASRIGDNNRFRENCTVHSALEQGKFTQVGDNNLLMVNAHVGHDATVGNNAIIVNNVMLGGHAIVEDRAYLGGGSAVHQFCRVGQMAMIGGQAHIVQDVPPFVTVDGGTSRIVGLNRIGLRRNGLTDAEMHDLKIAYRIMYRSGLTWTEVIAQLQEQFQSGPAAALAPFLKIGRRGYVSERRMPRGATLRLPDQHDVDESEKKLRKVG